MADIEDTPAVAQRPHGPTDGDLTLTATFGVDGGPAGASDIRNLVRQTLLDWQVDIIVANAALDVAHELVSNAVLHGSPPVGLTLRRSPKELTVSVTDGTSAPARRLPYRPGVSERGLGLRLVAQLSDDWGQRPLPDGKEVWALFRRGGLIRRPGTAVTIR